MTRKDRVLTALAHRQPDRVPIDFGSTAVTGMHVRAVAGLRRHYGLADRPVKVIEPYQMLGEIDEELARIIGVDVAGVCPRNTLFGFPNENWREWQTPFGQVVLVPEGFRTTVDTNRDVLIYPQGDTTAPPSGRMPAAGYFFDTIVRQPPIDEDKLDPRDNLEEFAPISDADVAYLAAETRRAAATGRAVMATFGGTAFGDIALVPAPFLKRPRGIRDIAEWYMSTVIRRDYVHAIFERQCEIALDNLVRIHAAVGDLVDVVFICGTDFGTQTSAFCSVDTLRELYTPHYKRINDWIHGHTNWRTFKHSCGAVEVFLDSFIECGFDVLNPVQCSATGMEPDHLKATYGDRLTFWGGGVDTQHVLPFRTPAEVREQVLRRCEIFAPGGGFIFDAIHNVQANVPVENLAALIDAVHEFNGAR
ncbi:MAG: methyltransferase [Planctomycetes bacterium]|nr:methyltransferase [Planctomycetota bacterium]